MNYEPNTIQWRRGAIVIHDADAKEPRMLMRIMGFNRAGLAKCQYVHPDRPRKLYTNGIEFLHDPTRFGLSPSWGTFNRQALDRVQGEWERMRRWNSRYSTGTKAIITDGEGTFHVTTCGKAFMLTDSAVIQVKGETNGHVMLEFVKAQTADTVQP